MEIVVEEEEEDKKGEKKEVGRIKLWSRRMKMEEGWKRKRRM